MCILSYISYFCIQQTTEPCEILTTAESIPWNRAECCLRVEVDDISEGQGEVDAGNSRDVQVCGGRVVVDT